MDAILDLCTREGVHSPRDGVLRLPLPPIEGRPFTSLVIIPLLSWYSPTFNSSKMGDKEVTELGTDYQRGWLDFRCVQWPSQWDYRTIEAHMLERSREYLKKGPLPQENEFVVTVSLSSHHSEMPLLN